MRLLLEQGKPIIFGGEGNGGLIFPEHQFCRDGGMTAAMMVFLLASTGKKLSELVDQLPKRAIIKDKITTKEGVKILEFLKSVHPRDILDETDGVKIFKGNTWALIRTSGTEPIVRIIIDSDTRDKGIEFYNEVKNQIDRALKE
jgi:phosphomannomutase/phosphoglucomutase